MKLQLPSLFPKLSNVLLKNFLDPTEELHCLKVKPLSNCSQN